MNNLTSVVVVCAGQAGVQTADSLREFGFGGSITLIGDEPSLPYERPPLSKQFLEQEPTVPASQLRGPDFYADRHINLLRGYSAARIDREEHVVHLGDGNGIPYDHLVLATGTRPRRLPLPGAQLAGVVSLRSLGDAESLRDGIRAARQVVIIGAVDDHPAAIFERLPFLCAAGGFARRNRTSASARGVSRDSSGHATTNRGVLSP